MWQYCQILLESSLSVHTNEYSVAKKTSKCTIFWITPVPWKCHFSPNFQKCNSCSIKDGMWDKSQWIYVDKYYSRITFHKQSVRLTL